MATDAGDDDDFVDSDIVDDDVIFAFGKKKSIGTVSQDSIHGTQCRDSIEMNG